HAIVLATPLRIRQDRVCFLNVPEQGGGTLASGDVRMISERQTPERCLDRCLVSRRADAQDAVIILEVFHRAPGPRGEGGSFTRQKPVCCFAASRPLRFGRAPRPTAAAR